MDGSRPVARTGLCRLEGPDDLSLAGSGKVASGCDTRSSPIMDLAAASNASPKRPAFTA